MQDFTGGPALRPGLVDRVKAILLKPKEEWPRIDLEPITVGGLYRSYVLILAAIGPVCTFLGGLLFGFGGFHLAFGYLLGQAIVSYVVSLISVFVLALIIDALAPTFNGVRSREQAFKVAAYASTAGWVGGVFGLIPQLAILALLASLYSLYLLYLGLPLLMKVAQDKAIAYVALIVGAAILLFIVLGAITAAVTASMLFRAGPVIVTSDAAGTLAVPGVGTVDLAKLDAASKQMAAAAQSAQASASGAPGAVVAAAPGALQALLPAALPGLARTAVSSSSAGAAGIGGAVAEARYGADGNGIKLAVTDLGAAGALASLGGALNLQSSQQDAQGYEKVGTVAGHMTTEKWNNASKAGTYSMMVGNRFLVAADGEGVPIDTLKAAVAQIDTAALERLGK